MDTKTVKLKKSKEGKQRSKRGSRSKTPTKIVQPKIKENIQKILEKRSSKNKSPKVKIDNDVLKTKKVNKPYYSKPIVNNNVNTDTSYNIILKKQTTTITNDNKVGDKTMETNIDTNITNSNNDKKVAKEKKMDSYITKKSKKNYFEKNTPKIKSILKKSSHKSQNRVHYRSPLSSPKPKPLNKSSKKSSLNKSPKKISFKNVSSKKQKSIDSYFNRKDNDKNIKKSKSKNSKKRSGNNSSVLDKRNMKLIKEKTVNMTKKSQKRGGGYQKTIRIHKNNLFPNMRISNSSINDIKNNLVSNNIINDKSLAPHTIMSNLYTLCLNGDLNIHK